MQTSSKLIANSLIDTWIKYKDIPIWKAKIHRSTNLEDNKNEYNYYFNL